MWPMVGGNTKPRWRGVAPFLALFGPHLVIRFPDPDHPATASGW
jgi:hypothetical protein